MRKQKAVLSSFRKQAGSAFQAFGELSTMYTEVLLHPMQLCNGSDAEDGFFQVRFCREELAGEQSQENKLVLQQLSSGYVGITILLNLIVLLERNVASQQSSLRICCLEAQSQSPDNTAYQDAVILLRCSSCLCNTHRLCQKQCDAI